MRFGPALIVFGIGVGLGLGLRAAPVSGEGPWSWQPVRRDNPPAVAAGSWCRNPVDRFILARLESEGVAPSEEAPRHVLFRRLALDLTGLPPTPEEWAQWEADSGPDAYERWVERRLASPAFGERWGRHWLDLARYADSDGYEKDGIRPKAHTYRDWVIRAWNADQPFDAFTRDQIAGDLIAGTEPAAAGFHRQTLTNREGGVDPEEDRVKQTVDRANTVATVWLGLTLGCAECHDHKYDPVSQRDYFRFYAYFNSITETDGADGEPTIRELEEPRATRIHRRGDFLQPGETVEPGVPAAMPGPTGGLRIPGRRELGAWLTAPDNPVVARVEANRLWQHLFGEGLVRTPEDFGVRGERPTHPGLLDWLASELVERGWSRKELIRVLVRSSTYRQDSRLRRELLERDPENRLWARQNRRRLEAEVIRDAALSVSGLLVREVGGPGVRPPLPADVTDIAYAGVVKWPVSAGGDRYRRGVYTFLQRTVLYPGLTVFDAPDTLVACTRRERSNTPLQALTLLNDPVHAEAAAALAGEVVGGGTKPGAEAAVAGMFHRVTGRMPGGEEVERLMRVWRVAERDGDGAMAPSVAVARVLLNLEEGLIRE